MLQYMIVIIQLGSVNMHVKQVIVIRRDLKMNRGKEIAQGAHASMAAITNQRATGVVSKIAKFFGINMPLKVDMFTKMWLDGLFTKITLQVQSEGELIDIVEEAKKAGIPYSLITDSGLTYFNGEPTITCCAIGPAPESIVDEITGKLKLY